MNAVMIVGGEPTMTSLEIAELVEKRHDHVLRDIRVMLEELHGADRLPRFEETVHRPNPSGGAPIPSRCYRLPKRETLILVSGYRLDLRARIIDRWQELEAQQTANFTLPRTMAEALRLAADQHEQLEQQQALIADQAPKVHALERLSEAEGSLSLREAAKAVHVPEKKFIQELHSMGWIYRHQGGNWLAYSDKTKAGYLTHKITTVFRKDGTEKVIEKVRVTPKGIVRITQLLHKQAA